MSVLLTTRLITSNLPKNLSKVCFGKIRQIPIQTKLPRNFSNTANNNNNNTKKSDKAKLKAADLENRMNGMKFDEEILAKIEMINDLEDKHPDIGMFLDDIQQISINLLKATSLSEISTLFTTKNRNDYSEEELGQFLYYSSIQEGPKESQNHFLDLLKQEIFQRLNQSTIEDTLPFFLSFATLVQNQLIEFTDLDKSTLKIVLQEETINDDNISKWTHCLGCICEAFSDNNCYEKDLLSIIFDGREELMLNLPKDDQFLIFSHIVKAGYRNQKLIDILKNFLENSQKEQIFTQIEKLRVLQILDWLDMIDIDYYNYQLQKLAYDKNFVRQNDNCNDAVSYMNLIMKHCEKEEELVLIGKEFMRSNIYNANITCYVDFWLIIAKLNKLKLTETHENFIANLKRYGNKNNNWTYTEFTADELVSVLSALTSLMDNDIAYVQIFLKEILKETRVPELSTQNQVVLTRSLYAYSQLFEASFRDVHDLVVSRLTDFSEDELKLIVEPIKLKKQWFPNSPLKLYF